MKQYNSSRFNFLIDSFPYACSIAKIINNFTIESNLNTIRVLQINSYPGIFAKNFAIALRGENSKSIIEHILHEENNKNLDEMKNKNFSKPYETNFQFTSYKVSKIFTSNNIQIAIINNFLSSNSKHDLHCLLEELLKQKNLKIIIGCESLKNKLDSLAGNNNFDLWKHYSHNLFHYSYIDINYKDFSCNFDLEFNKNNNYEKYLDLVKVLNKISCPQGYDASKGVLNELVKLDDYSANTHVLIAKFHKIMGNFEEAQVHLNKAKELDVYKLLSIH